VNKVQTSRNSLISVITASSVGTLIEWYDFFIFGSLATVISTNFFPKDNPSASFLATLATFSAGLIVRPLGALIFGRLGDIIGRKHTFLVTLSIMGISTVGMGFVPGYESIGFGAPVIVLVLRLIQGLALGGEYGGAAIYIAEHVKTERRGFMTSWIQTTSGLAFISSVTVILLFKSIMSNETWLKWGWRLPFIASVFLIGISVYIRGRMSESPLFTEAKIKGITSKNPIRDSFGKKNNLKVVLLAFFGLMMGIGTIGWITFYAQSFFLHTLHIDYDQANKVIIIGIIIGVPFFLFFGWLSDRIGRKTLMLTGMLVSILAFKPIFKNMYSVAYPQVQKKQITNVVQTESSEQISDSDSVHTLSIQYLYNDGSRKTEITRYSFISNDVKKETINSLLLSKSGMWTLIFWIFILQFLFTVTYGPLAAYMVELFPLEIRYTSISLPYHFGVGIFGGLAPYFASYLVDKASMAGRPDYYLAGLNYPIILSLISVLVGFVYLKENNSKFSFQVIPRGVLNPIKKWMGILWISLSLLTIWYGAIATGVPKIFSGKQDDIIFGLIITIVITPALALGLFTFGVYALKGEYNR